MRDGSDTEGGGILRPGVAIPTWYGGIKYRSRLEANTASFLNDFNIKFEYESKSFKLPSGHHFCPDFWLPDHRSFLECRGYQTETSEAVLEEFGNWWSGEPSDWWGSLLVFRYDRTERFTCYFPRPPCPVDLRICTGLGGLDDELYVVPRHEPIALLSSDCMICFNRNVMTEFFIAMRAGVPTAALAIEQSS
jgi:hypothetical protein